MFDSYRLASVPGLETGAQGTGGTATRPRSSLAVSLILLVLVLAGLPVAVWLDLRDISETTLRSQVDALSAVIDDVRGYYAQNVVARVSAHHGQVTVSANYQQTPGAIPLPATLSLELGSALHGLGATRNMGYRFFSDLPFANRAPHVFDDFERAALETLRAKREGTVYDISGSILDRRMRLITPVIMSAGCVECHNSDPASPKRDWKIGDVRGIEEFTVGQHLGANIFAFKYLMLYFVFATIVGVSFVGFLRHQATIISRTNAFLAGVAGKLSKYLSPQHFRSIFSGEKDAVVSTERKKLTIFFSDVVNFTAATERMQPEELTALLNEYLTEMAQVAAEYGGTVNKFIGDAMLVFFGDPHSKGTVEDARACVRMAFAMQNRLSTLNVSWRGRGIEEPFRCRIGINTGYCNVGNFGSDERMDYTIIGAEANLAARLQSIAKPGGIVMSYETFAHVSDLVHARALEPMTLKGIPRPVVPYEIDGPNEAHSPNETSVVSLHVPGVDLFLDTGAVDAMNAAQAIDSLEAALARLRKARTDRSIAT
ncbi:adenylate/guanylate cyclase domain-containing protein [Methyloraptor flagellatus]|uniref:Adenylate/guanylate cyclase domain-containing protein n=1 Tax=Methyloraptor flagellatus TaxID=3162530 RepID=A0AAU7X4C7_9HYPH